MDKQFIRTINKTKKNKAKVIVLNKIAVEEPKKDKDKQGDKE